MAFGINHRKLRTHGSDFRRRRRRCKQNVDVNRLVGFRRDEGGGGQPGMNFVFRAVRPDPGDATQCSHARRRHIVESGNEGVVRHILNQFHARLAQLRAPGRFQRAGELDEKKPGDDGIGALRSGHHRAVGA